MNYNEMTVKQLKEVAKDLNITGRHGMNKAELISAIEENQVVEVEPVVEEVTQVEETKPTTSRGGRVRTIEVVKDGQVVATIEGVVETLKWAVENGVSNQGWVKHSLKTGKETVAGRKFKEGGYLFRYADK